VPKRTLFFARLKPSFSLESNSKEIADVNERGNQMLAPPPRRELPTPTIEFIG
jgi:hypothetical protein